MARPNKQKISTQSDVGGGLFQAFGALESQGLPPGPTPPPLTSEDKPVVASKKMGRVVLRKETAHRGGKTVIVIDGFQASHTDAFIEKLARQLRQQCGSGGAVRERAIELQGEQVAKIRAFLEAEGFTVAGIR